MSASTQAPADLQRDLAATAGLTLFSLAVAVGFARVFSGWEFFTDLALIVVVGHGASFLLRRTRVSGWLAIPALTALLLWLLVVVGQRSESIAHSPFADHATRKISRARDIVAGARGLATIEPQLLGNTSSHQHADTTTSMFCVDGKSILLGKQMRQGERLTAWDNRDFVNWIDGALG